MDNNFAKLFEVDGFQVLVFSEYESDTEETIVHHITLVDGITAHAKIILSGENQEVVADRYLSEYNQGKAEIFRNKMVETLTA